MRTPWGKGHKKNKQHAITETRGLLLIGIRDGLSKEVTFKLDPNVRKKLAGTRRRNRGTARANTEVGKKVSMFQELSYGRCGRDIYNTSLSFKSIQGGTKPCFLTASCTVWAHLTEPKLQRKAKSI